MRVPHYNAGTREFVFFFGAVHSFLATSASPSAAASAAASSSTSAWGSFLGLVFAYCYSTLFMYVCVYVCWLAPAASSTHSLELQKRLWQRCR